MSSARRRAVDVFVVPVLKRNWLWHARGAEATAGSSNSSTPLASKPWTSGATLSEKVRLARKQATRWARGKLHEQWALLAAAEPNSFRGVMHRLSQAVLEREDPDAAFLRSLPPPVEEGGESEEPGGDGDGGRGREGGDPSPSPPVPRPLHFTLHHPASQPERLVRRRTRLLLRKGRAEARRRLWGWTAVSLPLLPVLLTPLPALPLYFSIWKAWTARADLRGSRGLAEALEALAEEQSAGARAAVAAKAAAAAAAGSGGGGAGGGGENDGPDPLLGRGTGRSDSLPPRGSWADAALAAGPEPAPGEFLDIFEQGERSGAKRRGEGEGGEERSKPLLLRPRISFVASEELDPPPSSPPSSSSSSSHPPLLSLEAAEALEKALNVPGLKEGVQRVLRRARKEVEEAGRGRAATTGAAPLPPPPAPSPSPPRL